MLKVSAKTDLGKIRQINQDYYVVKNDKVGIFPNLFLLADGVGSNKQSGFASKHCCDFVIDEAMRSSDENNYINLMARLYKLVNIDLYNRIVLNAEYRGMGTTMVMSTIDNNKLYVGNVGDSRLYHIRGEIIQVTRDHSLAEEMAFQNQVVRYSDKYYEYKNQLTRAIGAGNTIKPDFFEVEVMVGDYILMCSDGLSNMVDDESIKRIVLSDDVIDEKVDKLVRQANENGGKDNIAVILIYIEDIDKTRMLLDMDKKDYMPHVEVDGDEDIKIYDKNTRNIDLSNLKVNVDDIYNNDRPVSNMQGRSRKRQDEYNDDNIIDIDIKHYERKEGNDYDYQE